MSRKKISRKLTNINQVRIIGGQFKRRNISFIDASGLRPTPDRLRETIFNWLMHNIHGSNVLDACSGSGVLGFEALSRGASKVTFIEANQKQCEQLIDSTNQLRLSKEQVSIHHGEAQIIISTLDKPFDLVFLDPPYSSDLWLPIIYALLNKNLITNDTILYIESDRDLDLIFEQFSIEYEEHQIIVLKTKKIGIIYSSLIQIIKN